VTDVTDTSGMTCVNHPGAVGSIVRCSRRFNPFCQDCLVRLQGRPFCANCKLEHVRDVASGVDASRLALATIGRRFAALFIDGLILGLPLFILMMIFMFGTGVFTGGDKETPLWINFIGLGQIPVWIVYEGIMLSRRGQTLGKIAMNLKVVRADGTDISTGQAWGRAAVRSLLASFLSLLNYIPALVTKEKTCLHDMAAKTRVVSLV